MRKLETSDLFSLTRILKKMNIKDEIKSLVKDVTGLNDEEKKKAEQALQIELVWLFVENIGNAEKEIYKFLADLTGMKTEEIKHLEPNKFMALIEELFQQDSLGSFFSMALK